MVMSIPYISLLEAGGEVYFNCVAEKILTRGGQVSAVRLDYYDLTIKRFEEGFVSLYLLDDVIFAQELRTLENQYHNVQLTEVVTRPPADYCGHSGRLNIDRLKDWLGELDQKMFYLCGPTPFNDNCIDMLQKLGVKRRRIRVEANGAPTAPDQQTGWPQGVSLDDEVTISVKGKGSYISKVGEPLLNSLERNGYSTENACRSGECSLCRIKLISGSIFSPPQTHFRKSDRDFGWVYSCVAYATSDVEIQL